MVIFHQRKCQQPILEETMLVNFVLLQNTSRSSRLQLFFKICVLRSFAIFTGKHLHQSLFLKNLQAGGLQLHNKRLQHSCFSVKFQEHLFLLNTFGDCFSPLVAASVFFKKDTIKQLFCNLVMTYYFFLLDKLFDVYKVELVCL